MSIADAIGIDIAFVERQKLQARIDLYDETIFLTHYDKGRPTRAFEVDPDSLASAFAGLPITTGLLPKNTLFYSRAGGDHRLAVFVPAAVRTLALATETDKAVTIPTPPLVFAGGPGVRWHVFAVKQYPGAPSERLFHAPFPNVDSERQRPGAICRGDAPFPPCAPGTVYKALDAFLASRFNDHWTNGKSQAHPEDVLDAWRYLDREQATEYPLEDLVHTSLLLQDLMGEHDD